MDFNVTRSDIIGTRGWGSFEDYFAGEAENVYFVITQVVEAMGEVFGWSCEDCSSCIEGLEVAGAGYAFANGFADSTTLLSEASGCIDAVSNHGIFSEEAFEGYKEVTRSIGYVAADILGISGFMLALKVKDFALGSFARVLQSAWTVAVLLNLYDNFTVISAGTKAKPGMEKHKVELIEHKYNKNCYGLVKNLVSLAFSVVALSEMVFCPMGVIVLGFTSMGASMLEFYEKREMQCIALDKLLETQGG